MSTSSLIKYCTDCKKNLPSNLFFRLDRPETSTKTCCICREKDRAKRQLKRSRPESPPAQEQVPILPPTGPVLDTVIQVSHDVPAVINNLAAPPSTKYCKKCRSHRADTEFFDLKTGVERRTCSFCRGRGKQPLPLQPTTPQLPLPICRPEHQLPYRYLPPPEASYNNNPFINIQQPVEIGERDDLYGVSDDDANNMGADIGMFEVVEEVVPNQAVSEEGLTNIDPVLLLPQTETREFIAHLENQHHLEAQDEIRDIDGVEIVQAVDDPFDNNTVDQNIESVDAAPLRTTWFTEPVTRRLDPPGYISRYPSNLSTHDIGNPTAICPNCFALHFISERVKGSSIARPRFQTCCKEGQVELASIPDPPEYIRWLWTSEDRICKDFRRRALHYNRAFAFTSFNYTKDSQLEDQGIRGGIKSFSIHGVVYHQIGAVPRAGSAPKYAQLYFLDPEDANRERVEQRSLDSGVVGELSRVIAESNPFYRHYHTALESLRASNNEQEGNQVGLECRAVIDANCRLVLQHGADRRRENLPTVPEVAILMPDVSDKAARDIILFQRNGDGSLSTNFEYIHRGHPAYLPLHYVLFYPLGNPGYHWNMPLRIRPGRVRGNIDESEQEGSRTGCISARQFYRYHLFTRQQSPSSPVEFNSLLHGERLFQQLLCDMYACVDDNVLTWHRQNQSLIRSDLYRGVIDALRTDDQISNIGEPVILASSYHGGDRHMTQCYQNAMAITRVLGKPSLFITFTANPKWGEISRQLRPGQPSDARPDIIARVFKQKLDALLHDLKDRSLFGKVIGCVYTIEYQKRGLPHAHILLFLHSNDVPRCAEQVDQIVMARIPSNDAALTEIIKSQMTHGPCGSDFPRSPCMRDGKCSKGFPKRWCEETVMTEGSYPEYARPCDGQTWGGERFTFDNRWVVPFNPYLSKKFNAHINVEVAKGVHAIKYLAKYVYKGSDRATVAIGDKYDEITMTVQGRYISPAQAVWRLFEYTTHQEKPAVMNLPFHLEDRHRVVFGAELNPAQVAAAIESQSSAFLDWMEYNRRHEDGRDLLYSDFPFYYTHVRGRGWHQRVKGNTIGRMPIAHPSQLEHFHLRTLLTVKRGAQSYRDLYTVDGTEYDRPSAACRAMGLIVDDSEWVSFFNQIKDSATGYILRRTLATILANSVVTSAKSLWDQFKEYFTDDCVHRMQANRELLNPPPSDWTESQSRYDYGLYLLGENLRDFDRDWSSTDMDGPTHIWLNPEPNNNPLLIEALDFDAGEENSLHYNCLSTLSPGQRAAYHTIINIIDNGRRPNSFFLQGPAGTGKTFLYKTLCHYYRSQGKIVLCVASSGIAALLLPNGRTSHSLFKIPINSNEDTRCRVSGNSNLAKLLRRTELVIWDEVTLQNKFDFAAVDKLLKELLNNSELFGGVPVVLGGDFAQILPVVKRGRREHIVNACIQSWSEWRMIQPLFLTQNMRVLEGDLNQRFAEWLSRLPYSENMYGLIAIPEWILTTDDRKVFQEFVYPLTLLRSGDCSIFTDRSILSSRNDSVELFNNELAGLRNAPAHEYVARDEVKDDEAGHISDYPSEFLLSLSGPGLPQGKLTLQVGMPVMLLRNFYPKKGLCNGTRLIVTHLYQHGVQARIVSSDNRYNGKVHFIHRIPVTSNDELPFTLIRNQLPLRPCFAMTINKSQGQTLQRVGVDLSTSVFSHGQLYVALSRVTDVNRLIILLPNKVRMTTNIVYPEVLLRPEA